MKSISKYIVLALLICSCKNDFSQKKSKFNLQKDITNFSEKLEHGDTLIIHADLSVCLVERDEKIILTKYNNNKVFLTTSISSNLIENDTQLKTTIYQQSKTDSLNFEDLFKYLQIKGTQNRHTNSEIFHITYKHQNISFFSDGINDNITIGEYYSRIMRRIYPDVYIFQPPKMIEFVAPKLKTEPTESSRKDSEILD